MYLDGHEQVVVVVEYREGFLLCMQEYQKWMTTYD
jgi:hypothetical protein